MTAILKRELQSYFHTPVGYVFMFVFLVLSSVIFYLQILQQRSSDLLTFFGQISYFWMLLSPVLTMRLLAEERQKQTDQLLLTSPISLPAIVFGKYLAAVTVMLVTALLTLGYVLIVALYGRVYPGELLTGYLGFLLEGCAFLALDLFLSGCAASPVTAALLAFGANLALWMADLLVDVISFRPLASILSFLSIYGRSEPFLMGQLSFASVMYLVIFALGFLLLAVHQLDRRRCGRS